ncbi:MAG: PfaB family protein, partial [Proteobacteria bacterium]|nr:PfaB family protein [Pseudomonadota bacterium]
KNELTVSIVGSDKTGLKKEVESALEGIPTAISTGNNWSTPRGSYFTPSPLGVKGKLSFVYPGGFTSYLGMNRDLFQIFPQLHDVSEQISSHPDRMFRDSQLFPRSLFKPSDNQTLTQQNDLVKDAIGMFETGIAAAIFYTHIAQNILKISPQSTFGYSMGEVSMMYAFGCWGNTDLMSDILHNKPVFKERLAGPMKTAREAWGLPENPTDPQEVIWECYTVSASIDEVETALDGIGKVYAIIVNNPLETVIAGAPESCQKLLSTLDKKAVKVPMTDVIHCELVKADYDKIVELHTAPVLQHPDVDFYTAMNCQKTEINSDLIAHNIAQLYCQRVDFPKLINKTYQDGARIFLELGPQGSCSKNIKATLADKEHLAIGINRKGVDDYTALILAIAQLKSHRVAIDLSHLYPQEQVVTTPRKSLVDAVSPGGNNIYKIINQEIDADFINQLDVIPRKSSEVIPEITKNNTSVVNGSLNSFETFHHIMDQSHHHRKLVSKTQNAFLQARKVSMKQLSETLSLRLSLGVDNKGPSVPQNPVIFPQKSSLLKPVLKSVNMDRREVEYTEDHIYEFALGSISKCFGDDFSVYDGRKSQRNPNGDLQLLSRVIKATGKRKEFQKSSSMVGEYDIHRDSWFFEQNSYPVVPYAVIMEIALQPCGFLGAYMGSPLIYPEVDLCFRNLDATANLLSYPDLRDKVVTCKAVLNSTSSSSETVIQQYEFQLLSDDKLFYEGKTTFGYFTAEALGKQLGIDNGKQVKPWIFDNPNKDTIEIDLKSPSAIDRLYTPQPKSPFYYMKQGQLDLLDNVKIIDNGGDYQKGYIYAEKEVDQKDWFFPFHFHEDPVMPGSLGVEAILQSMKIYALHSNLGKDFTSPCFGHHTGQMIWKYRGQIVPANNKMSLDVHIKSIEREHQQTIIKGDANLWKDGLRIYTVKDAAITINEAMELTNE